MVGVGGWCCGVSVGAGVGLYCAVSVGVGIDVGVGVGVPGLLDFMQVGHIDILQWVDSQ